MISVSVIIPTYNAAETIVCTIKSVTDQEYPPKEILVVDDCSTDNTLIELDKLTKIIPNLRIIKTERNFGGPAGPRNIGVRNATSEYVAFLDSDDLWHPKFLAICLKYINLDYSMISSTKFPFKTPQLFKNISAKVSDRAKHSRIKLRKITYTDLLNTNLIVNSSALIAREKLLGIMFDESNKFVAVEDFIAWCNVHKIHGASLQLDLRMVGYRVHSSSLSANKLQMLK